ncbi:MAG: OmpA family protein [Cyclobacteriaceae bacterium]|nr:OmpA family protein [Cyclobacteriaceae bacterium]
MTTSGIGKSRLRASWQFILLTASLLLSPLAGKSQQDAEGCKDHALFTRINNFYIASCVENYNELPLRLAANKTETKEGNLISIEYDFNSDAGEKMKSPLQIIKNYENAVVKNGGKLIYKNTNSSEADIEATFSLSTREKEYWVRLSNFAGNGIEVEGFTLSVLEMEAMKQEVDASEMFETITQKGSVALYINFETAKSEIRTDSKPIIDQIAAMLKQNPDLNVSIEGHTDNVGTEKSNQALSESRAKSVVDALIVQGINKNRLKAKGWGQSKPIADNTTEEGKAKNRRVEIVKL